MTPEQTLDLARKSSSENSNGLDIYVFANLIEDAVRQDAIQICRDLFFKDRDTDAMDCAAAIRAQIGKGTT